MPWISSSSLVVWKQYLICSIDQHKVHSINLNLIFLRANLKTEYCSRWPSCSCQMYCSSSYCHMGSLKHAWASRRTHVAVWWNTTKITQLAFSTCIELIAFAFHWFAWFLRSLRCQIACTLALPTQRLQIELSYRHSLCSWDQQEAKDRDARLIHPALRSNVRVHRSSRSHQQACVPRTCGP